MKHCMIKNAIMLLVLAVSLNVNALEETTKTIVKSGGKTNIVIRNESKFIRHSEVFDCSKPKLCHQMKSCREARFYLKKCGAKVLDGDNDGIPCEGLC